MEIKCGACGAVDTSPKVTVNVSRKYSFDQRRLEGEHYYEKEVRWTCKECNTAEEIKVAF